MATIAPSNDYVLGHDDVELVRLERQGELFLEATEEMLRSSGIRPGMRVLDVGCGVGDVSFSVARLVGEDGRVVGIDRADKALTLARRRSAASGLGQVEFVCGDLTTSDLGTFDAVVGRFVLLHFPKPEEVLVGLRRLLTRDGLAVFLEMDIASTSTWPPFPELERCLGWILELYRRSGLDPQMGSRLYGVFRQAGLKPDLKAMSRIEAGDQTKGIQFMVETLRTMKPALLALKIADEADLDMDAVSSRLSQAMSDEGRCVVFPRLVGAWARVP